MAKLKPIRERAARALCKLEGLEPNITMEGAPMWRSFLPEGTTVLRVMLRPQGWEELKGVPQERGFEQFKTPLNDL